METSPPEPPTPSPLGGLGGGLVTIFRRELASWEERGAPAIPRPYVYVKGRKMSGKSGALGTLSHGG